MSHWNNDQLLHIADILLAAAHADRETVREERSAVEAILKGLAGDPLSEALSDRLKGFDGGRFSLDAAAKGLGALDGAHRREVLALVSRVTESDDVHDLDESEFIMRLARAIGASKDDYAGLTVELTASAPPPVPPKA